MSAVAFEHEYRHAGPWTEDEYLALPESGQRIELLDGSLLVSPAARSDHQRVARRLANLLETMAPEEWDVYEAVNVRVGPSRILIPDVAVTRRLGNTLVFDAQDVLLVAEIVSPSSKVTDRLLKPELNADAGIAWYMRVELGDRGDIEVVLSELVAGRYEDRACVAAGQQLRATIPFEVAFDPAVLLRHRGSGMLDAPS